MTIEYTKIDAEQMALSGLKMVCVSAIALRQHDADPDPDSNLYKLKVVCCCFHLTKKKFLFRNLQNTLIFYSYCI
jgi:hypothetical protein